AAPAPPPRARPRRGSSRDWAGALPPRRRPRARGGEEPRSKSSGPPPPLGGEVASERTDGIFAAAHLHRFEVQAAEELAPRLPLPRDQPRIPPPQPLGSQVDLHPSPRLRILQGGEAESRKHLLQGIGENHRHQFVPP